MKSGARVRMSEALKAKLRGKCGLAGKHLGPFDPDDASCDGCSSAHVEEFGDAVGVVYGPADYNNCDPEDPQYDATKIGPEVTVVWPENLRYHYHPDDLEEVN